MAKKISKPDLFESFGYKPHPGQILVHRSLAPRRVLACGVRWGKSSCAVMEACAALLQPRDACLGWTVAPTRELARLVFERTAMAMQRRFQHRVKLFSPRDQRLVVVNFGGGLSVLEGKTADNPTSLLGESLDFCIVDEAARMPELVWTEHLSQRLIDRRGWALFLSTPRGCDWFYRLFRRGQNQLDASFESWCSPSWDNPMLDRELIAAELERLDPSVFNEQYAAYFNGMELAPCVVCGGPSPRAAGVVTLLEGETLLRCRECQRGVNAQGQTLVLSFKNGEESLVIFDRADRTMCPRLESRTSSPKRLYSRSDIVGDGLVLPVEKT